MNVLEIQDWSCWVSGYRCQWGKGIAGVCSMSTYCTMLLIFIFCLQNTPVGTPIFIVNATDPDQGAGGSVLYSFQPPSNFFAIDSGRGIVSVIRELDYEVTQAYQLQVNATVSHPSGCRPAGVVWGLFYCPAPANVLLGTSSVFCLARCCSSAISGWFQVAEEKGCTSPTASHSYQGLLQEGDQLLGDERQYRVYRPLTESQNGLDQAP